MIIDTSEEQINYKAATVSMSSPGRFSLLDMHLDSPPLIANHLVTGNRLGHRPSSPVTHSPSPLTPHPHPAFLSFSYPDLPPPLTSQFCVAPSSCSQPSLTVVNVV